MTFKDHYEYIKKKIIGNAWAIKNISTEKADIKNLKVLYMVLIRCHFIYFLNKCFEFTHTLFNKLLKLERKAVKIILNLQMSTKTIYIDLFLGKESFAFTYRNYLPYLKKIVKAMGKRDWEFIKKEKICYKKEWNKIKNEENCFTTLKNWRLAESYDSVKKYECELHKVKMSNNHILNIHISIDKMENKDYFQEFKNGNFNLLEKVEKWKKAF